MIHHLGLSLPKSITFCNNFLYFLFFLLTSFCTILSFSLINLCWLNIPFFFITFVVFSSNFFHLVVYSYNYFSSIDCLLSLCDNYFQFNRLFIFSNFPNNFSLFQLVLILVNVILSFFCDIFCSIPHFSIFVIFSCNNFQSDSLVFSLY